MALSQVIGGLDEQPGGPLYQQLHHALRAAIRDERLAGATALPPERDIASDLGISRITVRRALDALAEEGLVQRRQGAGTFVAPRVEKSFSTLSSFSEDMGSRGRSVRSEWLRRSAGTVAPEEALALAVPPGTAVLRFHRIRYADEVAMAVEESTIAGHALASEQAVGSSLYAALEATGCRPVRALQRLRAVLSGKEEAARLGIAIGAPGLLIERRGFLADGRAVEFTRSFYRGDSYDFVAELNGGTGR
jgi:GntR family transcriptional regulator